MSDIAHRFPRLLENPTDVRQTLPLKPKRLPAEVRLGVWDHFFNDLTYFAGPELKDPPKDVDLNKDSTKTDPPCCPCINNQFLPLYLSKSADRDMVAAVSFLDLETEYAGGYRYFLKRKDSYRVRELVLDEAIFPSLSFGMGPLCKDNKHFLTTFPNLKQIDLPESLGDGMGLRFPPSLPLHIYTCLQSAAGPNASAASKGDLLELVRSDLTNSGFEKEFVRTQFLIEHGDIELSSTYRFHISASECLDWPLGPDNKSLMSQECEGRIIWDKIGMRITGVPDIRGESWWKEWQEFEENHVPDTIYMDDKMSELGWDLMKILKREDYERRYWVDVNGISFSFD